MGQWRLLADGLKGPHNRAVLPQVELGPQDQHVDESKLHPEDNSRSRHVAKPDSDPKTVGSSAVRDSTDVDDDIHGRRAKKKKPLGCGHGLSLKMITVTVFCLGHLATVGALKDPPWICSEPFRNGQLITLPQNCGCRSAETWELCECFAAYIPADARFADCDWDLIRSVDNRVYFRHENTEYEPRSPNFTLDAEDFLQTNYSSTHSFVCTIEERTSATKEILTSRGFVHSNLPVEAVIEQSNAVLDRGFPILIILAVVAALLVARQ